VYVTLRRNQHGYRSQANIFTYSTLKKEIVINIELYQSQDLRALIIYLGYIFEKSILLLISKTNFK